MCMFKFSKQFSFISYPDQQAEKKIELKSNVVFCLQSVGLAILATENRPSSNKHFMETHHFIQLKSFNGAFMFLIKMLSVKPTS